jgi:hypothetical protein
VSSSGFPDWQRITQWFAAPVDEGTGVSVNPAPHVSGPFDLLSFASVIVCVKANGGPCTVTVKQSVPGGPASLTIQTAFVVSSGNVVFEGIVLEAGTVEVDFSSASGGATVDYAIVPSNVNTNVAGNLLAELGFQHNEGAIANETAVSFDDTATVTFAVVDDPANARVKVSATAAQPVTSVFGRTGAVVAQTGDYTAAQVTNAADKASGSSQIFTSSVIAGAAFSPPQSTTGATLGATGALAAQVATATTNAYAVAVANNVDSVSRFVFRPDRLEWGSGTAARDTFLTRATKGSSNGLSVTGTVGGFLDVSGGVYQGASSVTVGSGTTQTPDYSTAAEWTITVNVSGATTLTIANALNPPATNETGILVIKVRNTGASGGTTLTWGGAYAGAGAGLPTTVTFGTFVTCVFVWANDQARWERVA